MLRLPRRTLFAALMLTTGTAVAGDPVAGLDKAIACAGCHGVDGVGSSVQWPNLAGQKEVYLNKQLQDFRDGRRSDPVMTVMAAPLTDGDIADLATYYSGL